MTGTTLNVLGQERFFCYYEHAKGAPLVIFYHGAGGTLQGVLNPINDYRFFNDFNLMFFAANTTLDSGLHSGFNLAVPTGQFAYWPSLNSDWEDIAHGIPVNTTYPSGYTGQGCNTHWDNWHRNLSTTTDNNDIAFTDAVIDLKAAEVDKSRIFTMGWSNGGAVRDFGDELDRE